MTALFDSWVIGLSAMVLDPEYVSFVNGPCDPSFETIACDEGKRTKDLSGSAPAGVHDLSVNVMSIHSICQMRSQATYVWNISMSLMFS